MHVSKSARSCLYVALYTRPCPPVATGVLHCTTGTGEGAHCSNLSDGGGLIRAIADIENDNRCQVFSAPMHQNLEIL